MLPELHELETLEKMNCPPEEKRQLFPLLKQIVGVAECARRDGIMKLAADLPGMSPPFLRQAMTMAVDGMEPNQMQRALRHYALCSGKSGQELLALVLIADGAMLVADGNNPRILAELLAALFGDLAAEAKAATGFPERQARVMQSLEDAK